MALSSALERLQSSIYITLVLLLPGVFAQTSGSAVTYVIYISIAVGFFVIIGIIFFVKKCYQNPESSCYKCKATFPLNETDPNAAYNSLSAQQKENFQRLVQTGVADTAMVTQDDVNRNGWHTPPEKENQVIQDLHVDMMDEERAKYGPREHIVFSYHNSVYQDVKDLRMRLKRERYRVWFQAEQIGTANVADPTKAEKTAKAIDGAAVVVPVLTEEYEHDIDCKKEIQYADRLKKTLIPVRMQKKYRPDGWLAFLLGNTLFHDMANPGTYQVNVDNFLEALEQSAQTAKIAEDDFDET
ncbi:uncharacterized protein [Watersipora subatra]|uniref:uncharacterized protein n=1 Tax=Watersipora subatra TaxID=2589382 RepID=UPI00355B287B